LKQISNYLFVYGTLLDKQNEFGAYLNANCSFYADGKFKGRLYDIGEYPGAVVDSGGLNYVSGKIFLVNNTAEVLKLLDDYEGFGPKQQQPNLFVRELLNIKTEKTPVICWTYLYNLPIDGLRLIGSGKYVP